MGTWTLVVAVFEFGVRFGVYEGTGGFDVGVHVDPMGSFGIQSGFYREPMGFDLGPIGFEGPIGS